MSHWDFGRPPAEQHDAPHDSGPEEAAYPSGPLADGDWWPADGEPAGPGTDTDTDTTAGPGAFQRQAFSWDAFGHGPGRAAQGDGLAPGGARPGTAAPDGLFPGSFGFAGSDAELDSGDWGEELGPYPVTYERDETDADEAGWAGETDERNEAEDGWAAEAAWPGEADALVPDEPGEAGEPWPPAPYPGDSPGADAAASDAALDSDTLRAPRRPWTPGGAAPAPGTPATATPAPGTAAWAMSADATAAAGDEEWASWDLDAPARGRRGRAGRRRWLIPAGVAMAAAAVGAGAVLLTGHHAAGTPAGAQAGTPAGQPGRPAGGAAGSSPPGPPSPATPDRGTAGGAPLTLAQAQGVLAGYSAANNSANAQRSATRLAAIETGSSLAIDTALYQAQRAAGAPLYPSFSPLKATYYIPRGEPATGPRWFAVQVANAFRSSPGTVSSTEYLLFTQSAPGAPWQDAIEPYLKPGAPAPRVALDADGLATAVPLDAATAAVAPGQLPAATAASLDASGGQAGITAPATLADLADQRFWRSKLPRGRVADVHAAATGASGQAFALRTADGGALVFYTDTARLIITPPSGSMLHLTIPGFFTPGQALAQASVSYLDQFAAYDPPSGGGSPRIVADYAAITGAG